ncbi:helix-turn-helix domain-containing protein [Schlegelella sp. S2-27]|uniref:Helix-turn-helix domain-containing protein n=1 Tax=Caldimonas mangrovi TaxID=2944811 RepID=A0ABT0YQJ3_9BURK|nr:helix-turn-helix domain-containing protein [Caldimonas mangrovi]MCM5681006.1 helix-turn-helix domain-containing protein [Caldimonas mangrovi]
MTEADRSTVSTAETAAGGQTAGEMLKAARLAHGVHIAALAASIKVSIQKLELLEADRFDELPDPTFARALAQTVCRFLKIDPVPVLARLPEPGTPSKLEHVARGLNQPFRDSTSRAGDGVKLSALSRPTVWLPLLIVVAAVVLWLLPPGMLKLPQGWGSSETAAPRGEGTTVTTPVPVMPPAEAASETVHSAPLVVAPPLQEAASEPAAAAAPTSAAPAAPVSTDAPLVVRTTAESWLEVRDANGRVLVSRLVAPGETLALSGSFPMRVRVGNAGATQLVVRGQPFDIAPFVRDNVARFDVK